MYQYGKRNRMLTWLEEASGLADVQRVTEMQICTAFNEKLEVSTRFYSFLPVAAHRPRGFLKT